MRQSAAIILSAAALVMFNSSAEARGFKMSFGKSSARAAAPVSKPVAANASTATNRGGTFIMVRTGNNENQNRPFAAAPRDPAPEGGPLHDLAYAAAQMPPAAPAEKPVEQKPEPPVVQTVPVFVSHAAPAVAPVAKPATKPMAKPAERMASAQPAKIVYCVKQANGACAPF